MIKNSQPFGKKFSENPRGDFFLTHTECYYFYVFYVFCFVNFLELWAACDTSNSNFCKFTEIFALKYQGPIGSADATQMLNNFR